jgi:hypothetical protein
MTAETVTLGGKRFVIIAEKDYRRLKAKAAAKPNGKPRRASLQERGDIAESKRRENEPSVPLKAVRQRLGL